MNSNILSALFDPTNPYLFSQQFLFAGIKVLFLIGFGVYALFAFAVVRQVSLMTRTYTTQINMFFTFFALLHFIAASVLWIFALLAL